VGVRLIIDAIRELRFALRNLGRRPGYAATVIATLATGIAGATIVVSLVSGALFRPPPFEAADRLVMIYRTASNGPGEPRLVRWSFPRFEALREATRSFDQVAAFGPADLNLAGGDEPERVTAESVSADYFTMLRARPLAGRVFSADEDRGPGGAPTAVLGHRLWVARFGGDRAVIGRPISVNGEVLTVVGVMPAGFVGLGGRADLWIPQAMAPVLSYRDYLTTDQNFISVAGRLRAGVSLEAARSELAVVGERIAAAIPDSDDEAEHWGATAVALAEARVDAGSRPALGLLIVAVGGFLLLACLNVAGLGLAEVVARQREVTVRLALGAGRFRVIRQLVTESALLGAVAAGLGVLLAAFAIEVVRLPSARPGPGNMWGAVGDFARASIDWRVLGIALAASIVAVLISGLIPAFRAGRTDLAAALRSGGPQAGAGRSRTHAALVVGEVAIALALAVGGGLLYQSLRRAQAAPLGIDPERILTFRISPSDVRYPSDRAPEIIDRVLEAVRAVPGVTLATVDGCAPLGACAISTLFVAGRPEPSPDQAPRISRHYVGPDHFATLGIPLLAGRAFRDDDRADRPGVAVINETAARRFFPGQDPLGQQIWFGGGRRWTSADSAITIVGVVGDVPYGSLERTQVASVYTPYRQFSYAFRTVLVKVAGDPARFERPIRASVASVDQLPIFEVMPLTALLGTAWARTRFVAGLLALFAAVSLGLAAAGVYGIVAHSVNQRTRELGIRTALGASRGAVLRMVVREGIVLALWGIAIGVVVAQGLSLLMRSLLFGVTPSDPPVLVAASVGLVLTAAIASYWPARRAARVDPVDSLKAD